ncbi:MAG: glutamate--tRNA ligase family protein [Luteolibacter sp.]
MDAAPATAENPLIAVHSLIPRTRFAPSPTGRLHLGHAYAAKVARDLARSDGGEFLLRFEDIDTTASARISIRASRRTPALASDSIGTARRCARPPAW